MRLGPIIGLFVFVGVVGACLEIDTEPTPVTPTSVTAVSTTISEPITVPASEEAETTTTEEQNVQSVIIPSDDESIEDIDCDDAENLCEMGAYICDDIADYCDYGPDDGQDLPDEFDWDE